MKKTIFYAGAALWLFFLSGNVQAQLKSAIGFKGGVNYSTFSGEHILDVDGLTNPSVGGFLNLGLGEALMVQAELLYTRVGAEYDLNNINMRSELDYIKIPILGKLRFPLMFGMRPHVLLGEAVSFKVGEELHYLGDIPDDKPLNGNNNFEAFDVNLLFGAGLDIESDRLFFTVDLRYNLGIADVSRKSVMGAIKNRSAEVTLGLGYKISSFW